MAQISMSELPLRCEAQAGTITAEHLGMHTQAVMMTCRDEGG